MKCPVCDKKMKYLGYIKANEIEESADIRLKRIWGDRCPKNVFMLWREGGEKLPITVVRDTWTHPGTYFIIKEIEIKKWPYGNALGEFFLKGVSQGEESLGCAGCYQWKLRIEKEV